MFFFENFIIIKYILSIPHMGYKESLNQCGVLHQYQKNPTSKAKFAEKLIFFARRFYTLYEHKLSNLRPVLSITFPQRFRISKNVGHPTSGRGGKKSVKRYLKSEHTDKQTHKHTNKHTDRHTDILTYRKNRPEVRFFENTSPRRGGEE